MFLLYSQILNQSSPCELLPLVRSIRGPIIFHYSPTYPLFMYCAAFPLIVHRRSRSINQIFIILHCLHKMQIFALILLSAIALVVADTRGHGKQGKPLGHAWVRDFDNLVAFGDRSGIPLRDCPSQPHSEH